MELSLALNSDLFLLLNNSINSSLIDSDLFYELPIKLIYNY